MRVAYFPDSFHEVNGVAHTSRHFEAFARRRNLPFLCVRAGDIQPGFSREGEVETLELRRGPFSFGLEKDLRFDLGFLRHLPNIRRTVENFRPDVIHITGPSEVGMIGAWLSHEFQVPLVASWHTNLHEYAVQRASWLLRRLPDRQAEIAGASINRISLKLTARFYRIARLLFAPNLELCAMLENATGKRCVLMPRGVDTVLFSPGKRTRMPEDLEAVLGFVGRLSVEKNVMLLPKIREQLLASGFIDFRFLIVGHGRDQDELREQLPNAELTGVLLGEDLARAYANMDLFVFPSHTDTFGNVVLEALSSGVPAIVTPDGGPHYILEGSEAGLVADDDGFAHAILTVLRNPELHQRMRVAARKNALAASWDAVFEMIYQAYEEVLKQPSEMKPIAGK